jgi:hypothetical protein
VLTPALALDLRSAGLLWTPAQGDRFVLAGREMDEQVFVLSDMTVEVHDLPQGRVVGFNGTTEWSLDSVHLEDALWLPREEQLRDLLGDRFLLLERTGERWQVVLGAPGPEGRYGGADPEEAYARAALAVLGS